MASDARDRSRARGNRRAVATQSVFIRRKRQIERLTNLHARDLRISGFALDLRKPSRKSSRNSVLSAGARRPAISMFRLLARVRSPVRSTICMQSRAMVSRNSIVRSQSFIRRWSTNLFWTYCEIRITPFSMTMRSVRRRRARKNTKPGKQRNGAVARSAPFSSRPKKANELSIMINRRIPARTNPPRHSQSGASRETKTASKKDGLGLVISCRSEAVPMGLEQVWELSKRLVTRGEFVAHRQSARIFILVDFGKHRSLIAHPASCVNNIIIIL